MVQQPGSSGGIRGYHWAKLAALTAASSLSDASTISTPAARQAASARKKKGPRRSLGPCSMVTFVTKARLEALANDLDSDGILAAPCWLVLLQEVFQQMIRYSKKNPTSANPASFRQASWAA